MMTLLSVYLITLSIFVILWGAWCATLLARWRETRRFNYYQGAVRVKAKELQAALKIFWQLPIWPIAVPIGMIVKTRELYLEWKEDMTEGLDDG